MRLPAPTIRPTALLVSVTALVLGALGMPAAGATSPPAVLAVGPVAAQDVPVLPGSEPDTLVEPDVAVSPRDPKIAIAAAHDGRYPDGGAVGIETAWTHDGGVTWQHKPLPRLTSATGGSPTWARASDPVVAFGPDGVAYVSTLLFNTGCDSAVAVSRSTDGGRTFGAPRLVHRSASCAVSDDKNWLIVDNQAASPHRGRLYQFWTPFLTDLFGNSDGSPQALSYSDDHGATWSAPVSVSGPHANTQNSQPMILPSGTLVDAYEDFGANASAEGPEAGDARAGRQAQAVPAAAAVTNPSGNVVTAISTDGGRTWRPGGLVTRDLGAGPPNVRCCLPSSVADPVTGVLYTAWNSLSASEVKLARSTDGVHWSAPVVIDPGAGTRLGVNVDVSALSGTVAVSFGLLRTGTGGQRLAQQYVATSRDRGLSFGSLTAVGPVSDYRYAAQADGAFPGDYVGSAMSAGRYYAVWCVAGRPPTAGAAYHQVLYGASFALPGAGVALR